MKIFHSFNEVDCCTALVMTELDHIEKTKVDLPKNVPKNKDDSIHIYIGLTCEEICKISLIE